MSSRPEEGHNIKYALACNGYSNDDVGVARGKEFQGVRPEAGF